MSSIQKNKLDPLRKLFANPLMERVLLPIVGRSEYGGPLSRMIPGPHLYQTGSNRRVNRSGIEYELDISCLMQWYVYWNLDHVSRRNLYSVVKEGVTILDVGTNIGETLLNFAALTGPDGFVYGFEPDKKNHAAVQKNISLNEFANVHVFEAGVSNSKEELRLYRVDEHNLGMNRVLSADEVNEFTDFTIIQTTTLDDIIAENQISRVDLVKIDIEGYEMHALQGAQNLLGRFKPILFIEVGYTRLIKNGTSPNEMFKFLEGFGYKIYHGETLEPLSSDADYSYFGDGGIDVLAKFEE